MRIKRPRIRRRHFPASQSVFANDDVLHLGVSDFDHMQRLVIDRGFVQQLLDFKFSANRSWNDDLALYSERDSLCLICIRHSLR
jgi:hypothetical protein